MVNSAIVLRREEGPYGPWVSENTRKQLGKAWLLATKVLRQTPSVVSAIKQTIGDGQTYRILVSEKNIHLLKEGADGVIKAVLRDPHTGQIVEHVGLQKIGGDLAAPFAAIALQATLGDISSKLDQIAQKLARVDDLITSKTRGELQGAIDVIESAKLYPDEGDRRAGVLDGCRKLELHMAPMVEQLKIDVGGMPSPKTGFLDGWSGGKIDAAQSAESRVRADLMILMRALQTGVQALMEVDALESAKSLMIKSGERILPLVDQASKHARLLPFKKEGAPEALYILVQHVIPEAQMQLEDILLGKTPDVEITLDRQDILSW